MSAKPSILLLGAGGFIGSHIASALENEFIYQLYIRINRLKDILGRRDVNLTAPTMNRLIRKVMMNSLSPLPGNHYQACR